MPERDICFSAVNKRERLDKRNVALIAIQSCADLFIVLSFANSFAPFPITNLQDCHVCQFFFFIEQDTTHLPLFNSLVNSVCEQFSKAPTLFFAIYHFNTCSSRIHFLRYRQIVLRANFYNPVSEQSILIDPGIHDSREMGL